MKIICPTTAPDVPGVVGLFWPLLFPSSENTENALILSTRSIAQAARAIYRFLRRGCAGDSGIDGGSSFFSELLVAGVRRAGEMN